MSVIVKRPRRVAREVLEETTQRQYLDINDFIKIDVILQKADEEWSRKEFRFMMRCMEDIDEAQG